jgi:hypothetical protein
MTLTQQAMLAAVCTFVGYSSMHTSINLVAPPQEPEILREVSAKKTSRQIEPIQALTASVEMHTDGWTSYTTEVADDLDKFPARWAVVLVAPDGTDLCAGYGDAEYTNENEGNKIWPADYFTGGDCPEFLPFGSRGTVTYTPRKPKEHLPYILDFVVINPPTAPGAKRAPIQLPEQE